MFGRLAAFFRSLADFSKPFWAANTSELFERVAFYGMAPVLVPYLVQVRHFDEAAAIRVGGNLGFVVYGLTILSGALADWLGYRRAMLLAYVSLAAGYMGVFAAPRFSLVVAALAFVAFGASIIKPAITGTVQRSCGDEQRPVGFSIYYMLVNVGGFLGPNISGAVAAGIGLAAVFPASALAIAVALIVVLVLYRDDARAAKPPPQALSRLAKDFLKILATPRLMTLFLLVAGFWSLFFQFFGAFTLYLTQDLGLSQQRANLIISIDAALIIVCQVVVGYLTRHWATSRAVWIGAAIGAASFGVIGLGLSPYYAAAGVAVFSIGEMIYSAHFYKYLGSLAPAGQEAMYLGFAFLPVALGSLLSGWIGGPIAAWARASLHHPEKMFWAFGAVGAAAAVGLWLHAWVYSERGAARE
jgi:proton-dependent oligopeptide transporter, POT family